MFKVCFGIDYYCESADENADYYCEEGEGGKTGGPGADFVKGDGVGLVDEVHEAIDIGLVEG